MRGAAYDKSLQKLGCRLKSWGWEFDLKCDSLPRLGFKEVACIHITLDPPAAKLAYKNKHKALLNNEERLRTVESFEANLIKSSLGLFVFRAFRKVSILEKLS